MGALLSSVQMVWPRDLLFFDQKLHLPILWSCCLMNDNMNQAVGISPVSQVAIRLSQFKSHPMINLLWFAVGQDCLSHVILVSDNLDLHWAVETSPPDKWGFRTVSKHEVKMKDPEAYKAGQRIIALFGGNIPGLTCEYAVE